MDTRIALPPALFHTDALDRADLAPSTRRQYWNAITAMLLAGINPLDGAQLADYAQGLPVSSRAFLKAALKIMTADAANLAKANATPENVHQVQAILWRLESMDAAIPTHQPDAERTPHWLTQEQVSTLLAAAKAVSMRDHVILGVLLGAGLRREELERLTFEALGSLEFTDILTVRGKGSKVRRIPIDKTLAALLEAWESTTQGGRVARSVDRHGNMGEGMTASGIFNLVRRYGALIGIQDLDPHDLRRTFGRLLYNKTRDLVYVMDLLGHAESKTTQRYIGLQIHTQAPDILREES